MEVLKSFRCNTERQKHDQTLCMLLRIDYVDERDEIEVNRGGRTAKTFGRMLRALDEVYGSIACLDQIWGQNS